MQQQKNAFLGTEPVPRLLFRLAVPTVLAQVINMLYNIVDRVYIGHMADVGQLALTGVGVCLPIIMIISAFAALIGGGAPRASIAMGKGDYQGAEKILGGCVVLYVLTAVVLTGLVEAFARPVLLAFGASENTIGYAVSYMRVYAIGTLFVQLTLGMNQFITGQGFSRVGMYTVLVGAALNIALDPLFIFALHMGVQGAALATVISQCASCVFAMAFLASPKSVIRIRRENLRLDFSILGPCLALGAAPFIMQASESFISVCFNSSLLKYGGDVAVGAMTICTSVMQFAMLPIQGVAQGAQPITSYNFGARNKQRVRDSFRLLLIVNVIFTIVVWALVMLFPRLFAGIFTTDAELLSFTARALRIYCAVLCIFGVQISCQMTFMSIGYAPEAIICACMRKFVLLLPLIYLMPHVMKDLTFSVYWAEPAADILAVTFTGILFALRFRKAMRQMDESKEPAAEA